MSEMFTDRATDSNYTNEAWLKKPGIIRSSWK